MCKGDTIKTSWSRIGAIIIMILVGGGIIISSCGLGLTWGQITIVPLVLAYFINMPYFYRFTESGFSVRWMIRKHNVSAEQIDQVDVFSTKSGTWIVIKLFGAPNLPAEINRATLLSYYVHNRKKTFLLPLEWGERDKALELIRMSCRQKINILS